VPASAQIRVYRIRPGELAAFVREWREQIKPLRERVGFTVERAWASEEDDTFVWVLRHEDDDWEAADRAYRDSPERAALDPDPARLIESQTIFLARPLDLG
jgi:antibiotic biosynthesis monooxygenase (ABM) superfamily enzyme